MLAPRERATFHRNDRRTMDVESLRENTLYDVV